MSRAFALLIATVLIASAGAYRQQPALPKPVATVRLEFAGDILLARQVAVEMRMRRASPWAQLAPLLRRADWAEGNLEGAVGMPNACLPPRALADGGLDQSPCFAVAASAIPSLKQAGFEAIGVANNHSHDLGAPGLGATVQNLRAASLQPLSWSASPVFVEVGGVTLGVVALSTVSGRDGNVEAIPSPELARKLRLARALSNLVVVAVHWGTELHDWPSEMQRNQAAWLVAQGADLIVGSHPHVVEPAECVQGKPVFYSLGNLLFDQKYPATRVGLLASCEVNKSALACTAERTAPPADSFFPAPAGSASEVGRALAACQPRLHSQLQLAGVRLSQAGETARGERTLAATASDGQRAWTARPTQLLSLEPAPFSATGAPMLFTLERHPSPLDGQDAVRPYVYQLGPSGPVARWRGSALAWPLLDARLLPGTLGTLCALHRTDSYLVPDPHAKGFRIAAYSWDGFGFTGVHDPSVLARCRALLVPETSAP